MLEIYNEAKMYRLTSKSYDYNTRFAYIPALIRYKEVPSRKKEKLLA